MNIKKNLFLLIVLIFFYKNSYSQLFYLYSIEKGWGIGGASGLNYFFGDVNDNKGRIWNNTPFNKYYYTDKKIMGNFFVSKKINRYLELKTSITFGKLSGTNEGLNLTFESNVTSYMVEGYFYFIDYLFEKSESNKIKYYVIGGAGLSYFNSICRENTTKKVISVVGYDSQLNKTEKTTETTINIGLGVNYNIDKKWSLFFNTSLYYLNTDKLDAIKSTKSSLEGYGLMSFGVSYNFDFKIRSSNSTWEKSSGNNDRPYNPGVKNKRKKKLHNKWKK